MKKPLGATPAPIIREKGIEIGAQSSSMANSTPNGATEVNSRGQGMIGTATTPVATTTPTTA